MYDEFGMPIDASNLSYGGDLTQPSDYGTQTSTDFPTDQAAPGDGGSLFPVQFNPMGALGGLGGLAGRAGAVARSAGGAVLGAARRGAGYIMTSAGRVSVKKLWEVAKKYGPEVAAAAVGYSVADMMAIFASSGVIMSSTRHRRRGISSRDIRTTRRVVGFVNRMVKQIGCVSTPRHHARAIHVSGRR